MQINASNETDSVTQETIHFEDSSSIDPPTGRQGRLISLGSGGETDVSQIKNENYIEFTFAEKNL